MRASPGALADQLRRNWSIPLGVAVLVGGGALLVSLAGAVEVWLQGTAWVLLVVLSALVLRPVVEALVGPVLMFDIVQTSRRGRNRVLRTVYALLLLGVLFVVYTNYFKRDLVEGLAGIMDEQRLPPSELAKFAALFFHTFLIVQFIAVLLLAPAFTAGAIAEEREKGTLSDLLTTQLLSREIILGKLGSRLSQLILLLLVGMPILSLLQLLGGVDPALLVAGFALTLLTSISIASVGLLCSVNSSRPRDAIFLTYVIIAAYQIFTGFFCGAFVMDKALPDSLAGVVGAGNVFGAYLQITRLSGEGKLPDMLPLLLLQFGAFHLLLSISCLGWSMARLRHRPTVAEKPVEYLPMRPSVILVERRPRRHPHLKDRPPMLWKECYFERGLELHPVGQQILSMSAVITLSMAATIFACGVVATVNEGGVAGFANLWLRFCLPPVAVIGMLGLALRGAGAIASERDRQTLDSLLTSDLSTSEILSGKLRGCFWGMRSVGLVLAIMLGLGVLTGGLFPLFAVLLVLALAGHAAFAACLGLYCSLVSRTTLRATIATVSLLLAVVFGHWVVYLVVTTLCHFMGSPHLSSGLDTFHVHGLTPPMSHVALIVSLSETKLFLSDRPHDQGPIAAAVLGSGVYAFAAGFLWMMLRSRFGSVTGRRK